MTKKSELRLGKSFNVIPIFNSKKSILLFMKASPYKSSFRGGPRIIKL
jgi:hypothetical protein